MDEKLRGELEKIFLRCAKDGGLFAEKFIDTELKLGKDHPQGLNAHIKELIFEQKKSIKDNPLGESWISNDYIDIYQDYVLDHFLEIIAKSYARQMESSKGYITSIDDFHDHLLRSSEQNIVRPFFKATVIIDRLEKIIDSTPLQIKFDTIKKRIAEFGFFELEKVKNLKHPEKLVKALAKEDTPYSIALLDLLGFHTYITKQFANGSVGRADNLISEILDVNSETVKRNRNILCKGSKADPKRYTAHKHKEAVKQFYDQLEKHT